MVVDLNSEWVDIDIDTTGLPNSIDIGGTIITDLIEATIKHVLGISWYNNKNKIYGVYE